MILCVCVNEKKKLNSVLLRNWLGILKALGKVILLHMPYLDTQVLFVSSSPGLA